MKKIGGVLLSIVLIWGLFGNAVKAETIYESDGIPYEEGYIIIGESHIVLAAHAFAEVGGEKGIIPGLDNVVYHFRADDSLSKTEDGLPNTFTMRGNLFFVFEGNRQIDGETQYHNHYIYSNGKGIRGIGVEKIHQIMDSNPNIAHWNIISFHGAVSAVEGVTMGRYYARSYRNWISNEFPKADLFIMSHSTMTKYYKGRQTQAEAFDEMLKKRMGNRWIDCSEFFQSKYPDGMLDPNQKPDTIHWSYDTYVELFTKVIKSIQESESGIIGPIK